MFKEEAFYAHTLSLSLSVVADFRLRRYGQQFQLWVDRVKASDKKLLRSSSKYTVKPLGVSPEKLFILRPVTYCHN